MEKIFEDLPRGVPGRTLDEYKSPKACWKDIIEVSKHPSYQYSNDKLFIGQAKGQLLGIDDDRHAMLVSGSRGGKGRSVITPNLLEYKGSVLAIDPKGELANITARRRGKGGKAINGDYDIEGLGQRVVVLDPFHRTAPWLKEYQAAYNPLSILRLDSETLVEDAGLIGDAIVVSSNDKDPHWDDSARNFIEGVILHVATYDKYKDRRHLVTVWELLSKGAEYDGDDESLSDENINGMNILYAEMFDNVHELQQKGYEHISITIEGAAEDFFTKPDKERLSVLSTVRRHIKFLGYPMLKEVLTGHDFDLTDLKNEPNGMTIYLCLPAGRMGTCNRWLRLFINLALEAMEREERKAKPPVLLCLDEFPVLGHMKQIEDAAGQIAGFGVKLWPIVQDLTQLKALYKDRWETFMGNAGITQFFSNSDATTLEWISKRVGKTSIVVGSGNQVTKDQSTGGATGASWKLEVQDLLTADEAARYFRRNDEYARQLVIYADDEPLIIERVKYDKHPFFKNKFDPDTR